MESLRGVIPPEIQADANAESKRLADQMPRNFGSSAMPIPVPGGWYYLHLAVCLICSAVVHTPADHAHWHETNGTDKR